MKHIIGLKAGAEKVMIDERRERLEKKLVLDSSVYEKDIYIWGTGNTAALYQKGLQREKTIPKAYLDSNNTKKGTVFGYNNSPVIVADELKDKKILAKLEEAVILICSANPPIYQEIHKQVSDLGLYAVNIDSYFFSKNRQKILDVYDILEDDESKSVYSEVIMARFDMREIDEKVVTFPAYYCLKPFLRLSEKEVFVDLGAYVGDSFERFIDARDGLFSKAYLFEPDENNYQCIQHRLHRLEKEWGFNHDKVIAVKAGVGCNSCELAFSERGNKESSLGSKFLENGTGEVTEIAKVYALDDYFQNEKVSFIKADIESFEYDTLLGAKEVIHRDKPILAICIYHNCVDMYDIPLLLHSMSNQYMFSVKHHTYELCDTVLYAYPIV